MEKETGMDALTFQIIKMLEKESLRIHDAKPDVILKRQQEKLVDVLNRRGERDMERLALTIPTVTEDSGAPLNVLPLRARMPSPSVSDHSVEESVHVVQANTSHVQPPDSAEKVDPIIPSVSAGTSGTVKQPSFGYFDQTWIENVE